ncbi:hypothetical protein [Hymenobacter weizhouensis]|uniref:hypothetical protein n=1 Tax=Hymenobacter sp. YIM 151500-1 TaxID=2987689 RepID=UPI002225E18A|nr:hypothetical protein [Hymenobacter sp. YIM 151500-1]UYZ64644.1 hypothetical protein OIS53_07280 [Hymenobacter sp. YIM 151500-1]
MTAKRKSPQILVLDTSQAGEAAAPALLDSAATQAAAHPAPDFDASLCPHCGEPLAWHEETCGAATPAAPKQEGKSSGASVPAAGGLEPTPFMYALGQPVQPAPSALARTVIWRGQVKARHPHTGLVRRLNVYRLDDGYWDCYYEAELQAA